MRAQPSCKKARMVSPVLLADLQAPEAVEPGERSFDHPAIASQAVLGLDTIAGDAGDFGAFEHPQDAGSALELDLQAVLQSIVVMNYLPYSPERMGRVRDW